MKVSIIVAVGKNLEIGKDNDLLWHLPADMRYFKQTTSGHHVIMGRKSYFSIPEKYRPLPNRTNLIISRNNQLKADGAAVFPSLQRAIEFADKSRETNCFIIGGGEIYNLALKESKIDFLYVTHVNESFAADTFFQVIDLKIWDLLSSSTYLADDKNRYDMTFSVYQKK